MMNQRFNNLRLLLLIILHINIAAGQSYKEGVEDWQSERMQSLGRSDGWLSLIGLYWLDEGANSYGSDASNSVVFPEGYMKPTMGTINLVDGVVSITLDKTMGIRSGDHIIDGTIELQADVTGDPTILHYKTLSFYLIKRSSAYGIRIKDSAAPALAGFVGLDYFDISEIWRVEAVFRANSTGAQGITVPTFQGPTQTLESPGAIEFTIGGKAYSLDVFAEEGDDSYFIIFGDQTNGVESYGGGRFMSIPLADESGLVDLDFNFAYSPPCVFTPYATCPLPPPQNRLDIRIEAGEKYYSGGTSH